MNAKRTLLRLSVALLVAQGAACVTKNKSKIVTPASKNTEEVAPAVNQDAQPRPPRPNPTARDEGAQRAR